MTSIIVLMYHGVLQPGAAIHGADMHYAVTQSAFMQQLDSMLGGGYTVVCVDELLAYGQHSVNGTVAITFDDGHISNYDVAFPLLLDRQIRADFFVNPVNVGTTGYVTWNGLREMSEHGMSIQSHGYSHRYFDELTEVEVRDELDRSKKILEDRVGGQVRLFAPPGGRLTRRVRLIAEELGYEAICGSRPGRWVLSSTSRDIPRLAVLATTPVDRMCRWIRGDRIDLALQIIRYEGMYLAKRCLGNSLYANLRTAVLRSKGEP